MRYENTNWFREQRRLLRYTQQEIGDVLGVSKVTIIKWESDRTAPESDRCDSIAKALEMPFDLVAVYICRQAVAIRKKREG
jgi:DNA-binding XRE family transcriptional regulator